MTGPTNPIFADMAGFAASRRIHLCDFSNRIVGKNKTDEFCMIFRTTFSQCTFLKQHLYDFSYTIQSRSLLEAAFV